MTCQHCGAALPPIAMFCGECGRSVSAPSVSAPSVVPRVDGRPQAPVAARLDPVPDPVPVPVIHEPEPEPEPEAEPEPLPLSTPIARWCAECETPAQADDVYCAECGHRLADDTRVIDRIVVLPVLEPSPPVDLEITRILTSPEPAARFVLQFSTGESYTVLGSGLAGRNPRPEPGEVVDHLVTIVDPGRSVSKTHLEFGQVDGVLWVSDRHSGNGTVIHEPGAEPRACLPGRRYPVVRGTRIDLGEQFVVVS